MIQIKGLTKIFSGGTKALDNLELSISEGEIFALLGPNGAGKTTTIRILSTLSGFDSGEVHVAGYDVDRDPNQVRCAIGVVAQQTGVDYFLTGRENLVLQGQLYRMKANEIQARIDELATYFDIAQALDRQVATYSGGMRRKLDIATALIHRPKLIFLDEPTLGLDIQSRRGLWSYIERMNQEFGLTILLTTHYLEEADQLSQRIAIINKGKIQTVGTPEELKSSISGDSLMLSFAEVDQKVGMFANQLKSQDFIKDTVWEGNNVYVYVSNGAASVPKIAELATAQNVTISTMSLAQPTLDDVFIKYTGTSIESTEEEGGDEWWKQWAGKGGGGKWSKKWQESSEDEGGSGDDKNTSEKSAGGDPAQQWPQNAEQWQDKQQAWNKEGESTEGSQQQWPQQKDEKPTEAETSKTESEEPKADSKAANENSQSWPNQEQWGGNQGEWQDKNWDQKQSWPGKGKDSQQN